MDGFSIKLKTLLDDYPNVFQDRGTMLSMLSNTFPTQSKEVNLLMNGFDVGVVDLRSTSYDQLPMKKKQMQKILKLKNASAPAK